MPEPTMHLVEGCDQCKHNADILGVDIKPNTRWLTPSAVDEITAGLRATLEARTAALTRTIDRAEKAEEKLRQVGALMAEPDMRWTHDNYVAVRHLRAVLEGGR